MIDPYVYKVTDILKNLANIKDPEMLKEMEAEYTSSRLSDLVISNSESLFDLKYLCYIHYYIFQDIFSWAGQLRTIDIEKEEPALGGISIEYSKFLQIETDIAELLKDYLMFDWQKNDIQLIAKNFLNLWGNYGRYIHLEKEILVQLLPFVVNLLNHMVGILIVTYLD